MHYRWVPLLLLPIQLLQGQCRDILPFVQVTGTRRLLESSEIFEHTLRVQARQRLIEQALGVTIQHQFTMDQQGRNTAVTTQTRNQIQQDGAGEITHECSHIVYIRPKTARITLSGQVKWVPVTSVPLGSTPAATSTINPISREEWIMSVPLLLLYVVILLR